MKKQKHRSPSPRFEAKALEQYNQAERNLWKGSLPSTVTFTRAQFLKFFCERYGFEEKDFISKMMKDSMYSDSLLAYSPSQLPKMLSTRLAQISLAPYDDKAFWSRKHYAVTLTQEGIFLVNSMVFPRVDMAGRVTQQPSKKQVVPSSAPVKAQPIPTNPASLALPPKTHYTPWQFVFLILAQHHISPQHFGVILGCSQDYMKNSAAHHVSKLPGTVVTALAHFATSAPYNDPLFWRQRQFILKQTGDSLTTEQGVPLPVLDIKGDLPTTSYHTSHTDSRYDRFEDKATKWKYGAGKEPVTFSPAEFLLLVLHEQGITMKEFGQKTAHNDDHYLYDLLKDGIAPRLQRSLSRISMGTDNNPNYWAHSVFEVSPKAALPTLDLSLFKAATEKSSHSSQRVAAHKGPSITPQILRER